MTLQLKDLLNKDTDSNIPSKTDTSTGNFPKYTHQSNQHDKLPFLSATNINTTQPSSSSYAHRKNLITPPGSDSDKSHSDEEIVSKQNDITASAKEPLICLWDHCHLTFDQAELLYHHLCQDHVGRKSKKNLQLNCHWDDCKITTDKRDHITSHLRVHIPLKPFNCSKCNKSFKRPQDLKKHIKIHLESNNIMKKKRGPKIGTKRINKLQQLQQNNNNNNNFHFFIQNDIHSLEPVLTSNLRNKLQTLLPLPQISNNSNYYSSTSTSACSTPSVPTDTQSVQSVGSYQDDRKLSNSSIIFSPVSTSSASTGSNTNGLDQQSYNSSASQSYISSPANTSILTGFDNIPRNDIQTAATFFTKLSQNMINQQQQQQHQYIQQQSVKQYIPLPQGIPVFNSSVNNINGNTNVAYPMIPHLPPIGQQQFATTPPPIQHQQNNNNNTTLPPISALPVLQPRLHFQMPTDTISQQLAPNPNINNSNATYYKQYSLYQMNNGQSSSSSSNGDDDDDDDDLVVPLPADNDDDNNMLLDSVNLIKDYLICSLLEKDFESDTEVDDDKEIQSLSDKFEKTLKYPEIVI